MQILRCVALAAALALLPGIAFSQGKAAPKDAKVYFITPRDGQKLRGGFALQRTRKGPPAQWLLIKRRDEQARPGSDVLAEQPASAQSGRTLQQLLRERA